MTDNSIWSATGAPIPAHMAREQLWLATGGQTGTIGPESCEVVAQGTPDNTVRIMPGGFAISATSRSANIGYSSAPWQSYGRALYEPQTVEIASTSSAGGRTDVVGLVIHDPDFEGLELEGEELANHQFWSTHVVQNAGNNAVRPEHFASLRRPFLPLAQVRIPSSTATITDAMIHDIRFLAVSQTHTVELIAPMNPDGGNIDIGPDQTSWVDLMEFSNIQVPQWATRAEISMSITQAHAVNGRIGGLFRVMTVGQTGSVPTEAVNFLEDGGLWERFSMHTAGSVRLGRATMGGSSRLVLQVRRTGSNRPGTLRIPDFSTHTSMADGRITYEEAPMRTVS